MIQIFLEALWKAILKVTPTEKLQQMLEDSINAWIQKHLTPEELLSEGKDLIKLIKDRI